MKKIIDLIVILLLGVNMFAQTFNYAEALQKSLYLYDANKCGNKVADDSRLEYRGNCHVTDAVISLDTEMTNMSSSFIEENRSVLDPDGDNTLDLAGGYHDAGDHVQFGLPQTYSSSTIEWAMYEFKDAFIQIGEYDHMMELLRWASDYYLKCTYRNASGEVIAFCYQVGEGSIDHQLWAPPELVNTDDYPRPAYFATSEEPASDQCAGAAASLALSYINNLEDDPEYAVECLETAEVLYDFAVENRGIGYDGGFYNSSYDADELAWAAIWLYIATDNEDYLNDIISKDANGMYTGWLSAIIHSTEDQWQNIWVHSWDTKWGGIFAKLAPITNDDFFWYIFRWNLEYWSGVEHEDTTDGNYLATTPAGFSYLTTWGSARYNAAAQFQGMVYKKYADDRFDAWMTDQMNYIMGDNPLNRSYIVGYSDNYAEHPHHRAAHGSATNSMFDPPEHKHILWGALVGGPGPDDEHVDETNDYIYNEVAIDYNAGLVGALAGHVYYFGEGQEPVSPFPTPDPPLVEFEVRAEIGQTSSESSQITIQVMNETAFPPRREVDILARYYFNISELYEYDQSIEDVSFTVHYDENAVYSDPVVASGPIEYNAELGIYYMEFQWPESGFYGKRKYQFALIAAQDDSYTAHWDYTNDYSNTGLTDTLQLTENIVMFADGELVWGNEPSDNVAPNAVLSASPASGKPPLEVTFDASQSTDPNNDELTYSWDFGDGSTGTGATTSYTYDEIGTYEVTVTVNDGSLSDQASVTITVSEYDIPVTGVSVSPTSMTLSPGSTTTIVATITPDNATNQTVYWSTSNDSVATVSSNGVVTGVNEGTATITVTTDDGNYTAEAIITVIDGGTTLCEDPVSISIPFSYDGAGQYCWVTTTEMDYINSWNLNELTINGVDYTNMWSNDLPEAINGEWIIYYDGSYPWSHFEIPQAKSAMTLNETKNMDEISIEIYPNPFSTSFSLVFSETAEISSIEIIDKLGKTLEVISKSEVQPVMELGNDLSSGVYYVILRSTDNVQTFIMHKY